MLMAGVYRNWVWIRVERTLWMTTMCCYKSKRNVLLESDCHSQA